MLADNGRNGRQAPRRPPVHAPAAGRAPSGERAAGARFLIPVILRDEPGAPGRIETPEYITDRIIEKGCVIRADKLHAGVDPAGCGDRDLRLGEVAQIAFPVRFLRPRLDALVERAVVQLAALREGLEVKAGEGSVLFLQVSQIGTLPGRGIVESLQHVPKSDVEEMLRALGDERDRLRHDHRYRDRVRIEFENIGYAFRDEFVGTPPVRKPANPIVLSPAAVDAEDEEHLVIAAELEKLPVDEGAISRHPEPQVPLVAFLRIGDDLFDEGKLEHRLAAEERDRACAVGVFREEVHRPPCRIE